MYATLNQVATNQEPLLVEFRNVTVCHDGQVGLDGLTLSIAAREHVAILGPNGSGKSTLIKAITRDCYPLARDGSSLRVFGQHSWNIFELRPKLGIVHNDLMQSFLRHGYTGREVILSGFFSSVGVWPNHAVSVAMRERADAVLEQLEISHLADRYVCSMSTGEGRRLLIGRALVHQPQALILDEPTSSLDVRASRELIATLRKLAATTSIILVTHQLSDIIPEITRVVLLRQGKVFRDGPKDAIVSGEALSALFGLPVKVIKRQGFYHLL